MNLPGAKSAICSSMKLSASQLVKSKSQRKELQACNSLQAGQLKEPENSRSKLQNCALSFCIINEQTNYKITGFFFLLDLQLAKLKATSLFPNLARELEGRWKATKREQFPLQNTELSLKSQGKS